MATDSNAYQNPRTDFPAQAGNAATGDVQLDIGKLVWVAAMLLGGTVGSAITATPGAVAMFLVFTATTLCLGHSLGMHRRFIHRSYDCPRWLEYLFVHLGVLVGLAGPLGMLRTHDTRDWAQRQRECHDYFGHGQPWYRDAWWQLVCSIELASPPEIRIEADIAADPVYDWMERTWLWQQLPWALLLFTVGGWAWVFWGICSRVTVSIFGHWLVGYFAHNRGEQRWQVAGAAVQGYNLPWFALLTMGESWHNNHHAFPGSARLGHDPSQWDPGWWVLAGLQRIGLVTNLMTPELITDRTDLMPTDIAPRRLARSDEPTT
ncbi:MAG: acyl-CoA desaturase [Pseudomonadota bacterium]